MSRAIKAFAIPALGFWAMLLPAYLLLIRPVQLHYWQMSRQRCAVAEKLEKLRKQNRMDVALLTGFARQLDFRKHVLRQRLGYAEADEIVYIFEDSNGTPPER
ncbi:MAG: hypothetical protein LBI34_01085 [Puniceicoccales bacterium]|jgi:cell division protein FtsB|nr:hypothetical protein [Puniceicoccales bacterium]